MKIEVIKEIHIELKKEDVESMLKNSIIEHVKNLGYVNKDLDDKLLNCEIVFYCDEGEDDIVSVKVMIKQVKAETIEKQE